MAQLLDGLDVVYAAEEPAESSDDNTNDSDDDSDASLGSGGAAAAQAAAVPRGGGGGGGAAVVAENGLASLRRARLAPGVFGAAVALRNEPRAARRIEVAAVRAAARAPGVAAGDVLVAINGKPLPRGASAEELQDLVRSNPKYALAAVDALLWRARAAAGGGAPAGGELCVHCGAGAAGVTWARVAFPGRAALDLSLIHI